jgi:hypothetical protein
VDRAIAALAERQHDVVGRTQLVAIGISERAIDYRLKHRRLRRIYRGLYAVGHVTMSAEGRSMAAVLLAGPDAALSHRSAAAQWGMRRTAPDRPEVTVPRERRQCRSLRFHYGVIAPDEVTIRQAIPLTSVSRTVFDLASVLSPAGVAAALDEAEVQRLTDRLSLDDLLERYPHKRGAGVIATILRSRRIGTNRTRSDLEDAFLEFLDRSGLPRPETNVWLEVCGRWIEADCVWREQRIIAELDSRASHFTTAAFESDRSRDRAVAAAEWRPIRITWRQVHYEGAALEADLRALLQR